MEQEPIEPTLSAVALSALHRGNKIEAIKLVRVERGLGLKEAKDLVDAYVQKHPALQAGLSAQQSESARTALLWLACLIGATLLAYLLLFRR